jgi:hypothetical protein
MSVGWIHLPAFVSVVMSSHFTIKCREFRDQLRNYKLVA